MNEGKRERERDRPGLKSVGTKPGQTLMQIQRAEFA